jgi:hypothetical protein
VEIISIAEAFTGPIGCPLWLSALCFHCSSDMRKGLIGNTRVDANDEYLLYLQSNNLTFVIGWESSYINWVSFAVFTLIWSRRVWSPVSNTSWDRYPTQVVEGFFQLVVYSSGSPRNITHIHDLANVMETQFYTSSMTYANQIVCSAVATFAEPKRNLSVKDRIGLQSRQCSSDETGSSLRVVWLDHSP